MILPDNYQEPLFILGVNETFVTFVGFETGKGQAQSIPRSLQEFQVLPILYFFK